MADIRINALATTASSTASDDFLAVDGSANGTRKLNAYSPSFGGNATVGGTLTVSGAGNSAIGTYAPVVNTALVLGGTPSLSNTLGFKSGLTIGYNLTGAVSDELYGQLFNFTPTGTGVTFTVAGSGTHAAAHGAVFGPPAISGTSATVTDASSVYISGAPTGGTVTNRYTLLTGSGAVKFGGNLTVSGGTVTSGTGTLTLNSSANTVVLQSAGTTALTLDSSRNATFAGTAIFGKGGSNTKFSANGTTAESGIYTQANTGFVFFADNASATKGIKVDVNNGGLTVLSGGLTTATAGGSAGTWKLGVANTVSPTSPNRTITVDIGGTVYYIAAKTTND